MGGKKKAKKGDQPFDWYLQDGCWYACKKGTHSALDGTTIYDDAEGPEGCHPTEPGTNISLDCLAAISELAKVGEYPGS